MSDSSSHSGRLHFPTKTSLPNADAIAAASNRRRELRARLDQIDANRQEALNCAGRLMTTFEQALSSLIRYDQDPAISPNQLPAVADELRALWTGLRAVRIDVARLIDELESQRHVLGRDTFAYIVHLANRARDDDRDGIVHLLAELNKLPGRPDSDDLNVTSQEGVWRALKAFLRERLHWSKAAAYLPDTEEGARLQQELSESASAAEEVTQDPEATWLAEQERLRALADRKRNLVSELASEVLGVNDALVAFGDANRSYWSLRDKGQTGEGPSFDEAYADLVTAGIEVCQRLAAADSSAVGQWCWEHGQSTRPPVGREGRLDFAISSPSQELKQAIRFWQLCRARNKAGAFEHVMSLGEKLPMESLDKVWQLAAELTDLLLTDAEREALKAAGGANSPALTSGNSGPEETVLQGDAFETQIVPASESVCGAQGAEEPIRILHLSDLHFTESTAPETKVQWLADDIRKGEGLRVDRLDFLVISGDMTDKGNKAGLKKACEFVSLLIQNFDLSADRCILVPGNHDVQDREDSYRPWWKGELKPEYCVESEGTRLFRDEKQYPQRFKIFSDGFYKKVRNEAYPLKCEEQGIPYLFPELGVQFLTLNSCWQIDQHNRKRSGVHAGAIARLIKEADIQVKEARGSRKLPKSAAVLRIGVWHHAVSGPESMHDVEFLDHLMNNGVQIGFHGDVHELRRDLVHHWRRNRLNVIGAGSFAAPAEARPESTPRLYNLLEISRDLRSVRVHTRYQQKQDSAWKPWNEWPRPDDSAGALPYFDIKLPVLS